MTPLVRLWDISESLDLFDITESTLSDDAIENAEANEPIDPMDRNDPALPIDKVEPVEPMDRNESLEAIDHFPLREVSIRRGCARPRRRDRAMAVVARGVHAMLGRELGWTMSRAPIPVTT